MTENSAQSRRVSYEQVKSIVDFMGQHVEFASGNLRTLEARHTSKRLWGELTKILNNCRGGTRKTSDGWSKYWSDFKNKLKKKSWLLKRNKRGAAIQKGLRPLSKMEKRALVILGPFFEKKNTRADDIISDSKPEVKLESFQEMNSEFSKSLSDTSDRLSGAERSNDSESGGEYVDDNESIEPLIQNIYPKWLIEVEKKRADAELIRAKAEEQRAAAATRNAEAAFKQAEALRTLAEASRIQAEAIMRIAMVLESRGQREDMLSI